MARRNRSKRWMAFVVLAAAGVALAAAVSSAADKAEKAWAVHDEKRPQPKVVTPGTPGTAPSDAVVLFDGKDLSQWVGRKGRPPTWKIEGGYAEITRKAGGIRTKRPFGSCQLHMEWAAPSPPKGSGQGRGNSGVYLMGHYEIQVLDSYRNKTYADGMVAAMYGQNPPRVNASRPPGQWQTYDIIFHRPQFGPERKLTGPATVTVLHNGVLVQDHFEIQGRSAHKRRAKYSPHPDKLPISLQDHGQPARFRNIWLRPIASGDPPAAKAAKAGKEWKVHDPSRPQPKVVTPGTLSTQERPGKPPSDAIVLFDGKDLSGWADVGGGPPRWKLANGCMEIAKGSRDIRTQQAFGSCQLHMEWASPQPAKPGQKFPGNSGVFLMGLYELQVLDSYKNTKAYADGQVASIYGQAPPLVNASLPPGEWQTFDVIFHRPRFDKAGKVIRAATITVLHNGVLAQDHFVIRGATQHKRRAAYRPHADKLPLRLQQHGSPVRFRNIWIRPIADGN